MEREERDELEKEIIEIERNACEIYDALVHIEKTLDALFEITNNAWKKLQGT